MEIREQTAAVRWGFQLIPMNCSYSNFLGRKKQNKTKKKKKCSEQIFNKNKQQVSSIWECSTAG